MPDHRRDSGSVGLERSCGETPDWIRSEFPENGVELFEARFHASSYHPHRHDTYAISLTTHGVLAFGYRGADEVSTPGRVVVLHPDELHDGHAGAEIGFGYLQIYVEPALIFDAVQVLRGGPRVLPFVRDPVIDSTTLASAVRAAFRFRPEPIAIDSLIVQVAAGLIDADPSCQVIRSSRHLDVDAVQRARQFLDAERQRVVHSSELEAISGLSRFDLARQFRQMCGTSPYRYLLMRRLDDARGLIDQGLPLSQVAVEAGFADQAHFTRVFKAAFGLTPARFRELI